MGIGILQSDCDSEPLWLQRRQTLDWNRTWYTANPDLTQCFQNTVLVWVPCIYLWLLAPFYCLHLYCHDRGRIRMSCLCTAKMVRLHTDFGQSLLYCSGLSHDLSQTQKQHFCQITDINKNILILALCIIQLERVRGCRSSVFLFLFWVLAVVCSLVPLRAKIQLAMDEVCLQPFNLQFNRNIITVSCYMMWHIPSIQKPFNNTLRAEVNVLVTLVVKGYRTPLAAEDLWTLREEDQSNKIMSELQQDWTAECAKIQKQEKALASGVALGSRLQDQAQLLRKLQKEQSSGFFLLRTLARKFGPYFLTGTLCIIFHDAFMFAIPQVLSLLLDFMRDEDAPLWKGYFYATLMFLLSCLQSLFNHQYMYTCFTVGMRVKTAVMGLVYRKSLVINSAARRTCTVGEIVNLVSADTQKLMDFVVYFNAVWLAPIEIALCLFFLWQHLGPSALAGIATVILIFPLNGIIAKKRSKLQVKAIQMKFMDSRIRLMNEILNGIKILKFYAWEKAFLEQVLGHRRKELKALKKSQILYSISIASFNSSSFLIAFAMFGVYVTLDDRNVLDAQKVFVSMALINILKTPLSQLPFAISTTMQAMVSLRRLGNFLSHLDGEDVAIEDGTFSWSSEGPPCLKRINIHVPRGSLVAVVGHVGSGKSSLLSAMLGETEKRSGRVSVKGSVAYVPQQAWIQNATVQDNVIFGREKLKTWYHRVLEACALLPDLDILPAGDATEIGEKGLNLSGGQKQRVSLARAVYRKADVYLLDDPLSAVDSHVGQHIFDKVIGPKGVLRDKTRILVTHGMSFLPQADHILVLVDGEITESGSYQELLSRHGAFADFIHTFANTERKESASFFFSFFFTLLTSCLSMTSRGDTTNTNLQNMEPVSETDEDQIPEDLGKLTEVDKARTGRVRLEMYKKYFKTIGLSIIIPIVFLYAFQQGASLAYNYWLSMWADDPVVNGTQIDTDLKLTVFGALGFVQGVAIFGTTVAISICGIIASRQLHMDLLINVLRSPMSFFECTPSGNLLNRFAKEIDAIDCMVPEGLKMMLSYVFKLMEVCIIVLMATPFAAVIILPLAFLYAFVQSFYVATSCQLRRLEAVSRSPIYTHFNETVQGASVIRAFGEQPRFILQANQRVDFNQTSYFPRFVATRWLAVNLEFVGNGVVLAAAILSVMGKSTLSPGIVGLAVSHSLQVTGILSWIVRSWTDVENNIVSVERVNEYADTAKEASWSIEGSSLPPAWPNRGTLEFLDYGLQYRKGLELALKGITLNIHERERVGIVGRTGAGKSSLALGIFRILEAAKGKIFIDGVDIAEIGLHDLRSRITIIPQVRNPVSNMDSSLRMNLDPFDTYTDEEVWRSLELAHLKNFISNLPDKLNHECSEGGENLSLGQRQLVCLARALLRKTKILVLDEATAAVDLETDTLIQSTIRTQFEDCTVLTIAHRLNTIMDYTRVIVMDRGHIVEMESPANLIAQRGQFYRMCREAGLV
uniref:ABC-type glutathione-S-conjugate transporter n=1 Tax=Sparus aurata TaxID=8175 RepID=A0A671V6B7_SPAAU